MKTNKNKQQQNPKSEMLKMEVDKPGKRHSEKASLSEKHRQKTSFEGGKTRSRPQYIQLH